MTKAFLTPKFESELISSGEYDFVVGIDEVGRGSWAGPVAVGAYVFDLNCKHRKGIQDSKLLTSKMKESRYELLCKDRYRVKLGEVEEINDYGVGKTIVRLISDLISEIQLELGKVYFVIDGQFAKSFGTNTAKVIKGDSTFYSIAAASILAKVERDRLMKTLHPTYPDYGFITNVGYPSKKHIEALNKVGPCEIHRSSFEPIRIFEQKFSFSD